MAILKLAFCCIFLAQLLNIGAEGNEITNESLNNSVMLPEDEFIGAYSECVFVLSFTCLQKKTLRYLTKLDKEDHIPVLGKYLSFVKLNHHLPQNDTLDDQLFDQIDDQVIPSPKLTSKINIKVSEFFNTHVLRVRYGNNSKEDINIGKVVDIVEGRKKNKGDGGGGGDMGKKKMMMMAMMCMKMKLMMILPAMMGMMGIMSMKGVLLGGLSLLISKVLLIMKLMSGSGGKGGPGAQQGGSDPAWMGGGGGGGGWNAGGQDSAGTHGGGGGGGSGYNSHGEWQSRSGRDTRNGNYPDMQIGLQRKKRHVLLANGFFEGRKKKGEQSAGYMDGIKDYFNGLKESFENNVWD